MELYFWSTVAPILEYLIFCFAIYFVFGILGKRKFWAFIPTLNVYMLYKCYQHRVYKRNWGIAILIWLGILLIMLLFITAYSTNFPPGIAQILLNKNIIYIAMFVIFVNYIFDIILIYPLLYNRKLKIIFFSVFSAIQLDVQYQLYIYANNIITLNINGINININISNIIPYYEISTIIIFFIVSLFFYFKVRKNNSKVVTLLDYKNMYYVDYNEEIKNRKYQLLDQSNN